MYKIKQIMFDSDSDRYHCEVRVQDGVEGFYCETLEEAVKAVIKAAKVLNGVDITEADIQKQLRPVQWNIPFVEPAGNGGYRPMYRQVSDADFALLQEIKAGTKVVTPAEIPVKQVIVMRNDLNMRKGKMVAQGAHASMSFLTKRLQKGNPKFSPIEQAWIDGSFAKICVQAVSENHLIQIFNKATAAGLETHMITDSGKTEFNGVPTKTCLAIGPDVVHKIDAITRDLKLF